MITYPVVEKFISINGEGQKAGELAAFIRMRGCNLSCNYCDTSWANTMDCPCEFLSTEELITWLTEHKIKNVTLPVENLYLQKESTHSSKHSVLPDFL